MRVLLFYPHNPFELVRGVDVRFFQLIKVIKEMGYKIDLFTLKNYVSKWDKIETWYYDYIEEFFFFDQRIVVSENKNKKSYLTNNVSETMLSFLEEILKKKKYTHFIVSYIHWGDLVNVVNDSIKKIIMIEDIISLNLIKRKLESEDFSFALSEEIQRIKNFDTAVFISIDEMLFLNQLVKDTKSFILPPTFEKKFVEKDIKKREYDIFFIGYDNPFNIEGIRWFFNKIYPKLEKDVKILIVGKISEHIDDYKNVKKILYVEDLKDVYKSIKISVVPLFAGTGVKIKVLESLSFGVPVVTTLYGVIGLYNKFDNGCLVANNEKDFLKYINRLLKDNEHYNFIKERGEYYFKTYYSITKFKERLEQIMDY